MDGCVLARDEIPSDHTSSPPFKYGDVSRESRVPVIRPLPVPESRSLDQPVSLDVVLGIVDLGGRRVSLEDLESRKDDSTR